MMTNLFKIDMLIQKNHASYIVYDILYIEDYLLIEETIENRKEILSQIIEENSYIAISKVHDKGIALFGLVKQLELEGVVAKRRKSQYFFGKRTKDWIKFKLLEDDDEESEDIEGEKKEKKVEKAQADPDGYQVFKMPWSLSLSYSFNIREDRTKPINRYSMRYPFTYTHNINAKISL